ncbi:MAG: DinB family protein, partial [Chloroflexota bacterium]
MSEDFLVKFFEHNHWANLQIIQACAALTEAQLDAPPTSATFGTIRETLLHFVGSQASYLRTLTISAEERRATPITLAFADLEESARRSGESFIALARDTSAIFQPKPLQTTDGFYVDPFVVIVQVINHATEHREQIKSMITALGFTPP